MANIEKRIAKDGTVTYRARIRLKGRPEICAKFCQKTAALDWWHRTKTEICDGKYSKTIEAKKHTFADFIDRYFRDVLPRKPKSLKKQKAQLEWWKKQLGHYILADVTPARIVEVRDQLAQGQTHRGIKRSSSTVIRYLAVLAHAFTIAVREWNWLEDSPMKRVSKPKEPKGRVRFLDDEERVRLLQACKESEHPYLYIVIVLSLSTGMRQGEIINLTWKDVDFDRKRIILQETKNGDRRVIPLAVFPLDLLKTHFTTRRIDSFLLFPGRNPQKPADLRAAWEKALQQSEIKDFRRHDLRHSFASYLAMNKATLTELRILLGHRSPASTARYSHLSESHGAAIVNEMNEKIFGGIESLHAEEQVIPKE